MVAWAARAACRGGQDFPGAAGVAMAMRDPTGINESGAHLESFGGEKRHWPGQVERGGGGGQAAEPGCPGCPSPACPCLPARLV